MTPEKAKISTYIYLPNKRLTNQDIENLCIKTATGQDLTKERIFDLTGIRERPIASGIETPVIMAVRALRGSSGLSEERPDALFFSTSHPTGINNSNLLSEILCYPGVDFNLDIHGACSGSALVFAYLAENYDQFRGKRIVLAASEVYSDKVEDLLVNEDGELIDPSLSKTIFGDGAAATGFKLGEDLEILAHKTLLPEDFSEDSPSIMMGVDEELAVKPNIIIPIPKSPNMKFWMNGLAVYLTFKRVVPDLLLDTLEEASIAPGSIDLIFPHQPSAKMLNRIEEELTRINPCFEGRIFKDLELSNLSSASIPKAMHEAKLQGRLLRGRRYALIGFGAGPLASCSIIEMG